jgi:hypothetical protein
MKHWLQALLIILPIVSEAQSTSTKPRYLSFAVSNSHTAKPFGSFAGLFYKDFHPGIESGYGIIEKSQKKYELFVDFKLGYLFHRWVQHNISLSVNGGYRYLLNPTWGAGAKLGVGYQLSIPTSKVYTFGDDGLKDEGHIVRSQFITNLGFFTDKKINDKGMRIFMEYQQKIQTPFIREYVPLLPYNNLLLGLSIPVQ